MADMFKSHFVSILGASREPLLHINWSNIITPQHDLLRDMAAPFSFSEVDKVIKSMKSYKSPGPDGITMEFYKSFWGKIGPLVVKIPNDLMLQHADFQKINSAFITLIPKKEGANATNDFRPISLENSLVKIFSKLLANRLAEQMKSLIDNKQGAFT
ncbi:hypothetical protein Cni_G02628 [Canna indica]|uniref:Reverse transcriptase n=1 Tax=Canna indica TaxID=4628 RepID=A0AAQ3JQC7_9LILI|nr:hypothetical protein Cni_G02628 [Canna indica]